MHDAGTIADEVLTETEASAERSVAQERSAEYAVEVARLELEAAQTSLRHSAAQSPGKPAETVTIRAPIGGRGTQGRA